MARDAEFAGRVCAETRTKGSPPWRVEQYEHERAPTEVNAAINRRETRGSSFALRSIARVDPCKDGGSPGGVPGASPRFGSCGGPTLQMQLGRLCKLSGRTDDLLWHLPLSLGSNSIARNVSRSKHQFASHYLVNPLTVAWRRNLLPAKYFTSTVSLGSHHLTSTPRELLKAVQDV